MEFDSRAPEDVDEQVQWTLKRPLFFWIRLILGVVFILASLDKLAHPLTFANTVDSYQILASKLVNLAAIILPWVELVLGFLLIAGIWLPGAIALVNLLLAAFFTALVFNMARGLNVDCGCFTQGKTENPSTSWYLVRNAFFLLMGGYLSYRTFIKPPQTAVKRELTKGNKA
jgi:uncharacterized membrane protein YphA (DoxX/SURF4 family)